jgi:copper homeostasis protein
MKKIKLEICCFTVESALKAEQHGADRVELCDNYPEGGTTASIGAVQLAVHTLEIPVNVIVRPRGGDFLYSSVEYNIIKEDVRKFKDIGANGVVIGFLKSKGAIDLERTKEIVKLAQPMEVTFHRAFDMCRDPLAALKQLKGAGIKRILTSGAQNTVTEGIELLSELVDKAGENISIMPGCGVNEKTLGELLNKTKAREYHSASKLFEDSKMEYTNQNVSMGGFGDVDEYQKVSVDGDKIEAMAEMLKDDSTS